MSSTRKIEVYTFPNYDRILYKVGVLEVSTIPHLDIQTPATLIIGGKAFTHDEVKAMVDKMIAKVEERRDEGESDLRQIRNDIKAIAAETFLTP